MLKILFAALAACLLLTGCFTPRDDNAPLSELLPPEATAVEPVPDNASADAEPVPDSDPADTGPLTVTVTIPEGYTLARIAMMFEEKGFFTVDEFIDATQNGEFTSFSLLAEQETESNRCFKLEGYLFPDTYEFYAGAEPEDVIRKILEHTEKMITPELREEISHSGYTIDEILTIASIIEKEALDRSEERAKISSVVHNRLDTRMMLQMCSTINYVEGAIKPFITGDVNRFNEYYNTYKCPALPPGPICNPGITAIRAALDPAETLYFFFVYDEDLNFYFSETWEEHQANVAVAMPGSE